KSDRYAQNPLNPGTEDWSEKAGRLQVLTNFSDSFTGLVNIHFRDFSGPVLTGGTRGNPTQTRFSVPSLVERTDDLDQLGGSITLNKEFDSGITLTSVTAVEDFEREQFGGDAVPYESTRTHTLFTVDQFSQEIRLTSSDADRLSWILGAYYFDGELESESHTGVIPGAVNANGTVKALSYQVGEYLS